MEEPIQIESRIHAKIIITKTKDAATIYSSANTEKPIGVDAFAAYLRNRTGWDWLGQWKGSG